MNADVIVDDELKPSEPHAVIRKRGYCKCMVRIPDVHHYLCSRPSLVAYDAPVNCKVNTTFINISMRAFRTGNSDVRSALQNLSCISGAHNARQAQLAADNCTVTSSTATVGNNCRRAFHDRLPRRVSHRSY